MEQKLAILEVENEQLAFMKNMREYDADRPEEDQSQSNGGAPTNPPLDLGFPEEDEGNQANGEQILLLPVRLLFLPHSIPIPFTFLFYFLYVCSLLITQYSYPMLLFFSNVAFSKPQRHHSIHDRL